MKKQIQFNENEVKYLDYKDIDILKIFLTTHGRIQSRRRTGVSAEFQRRLETAIKRARFLGLLPYVSR